MQVGDKYNKWEVINIPENAKSITKINVKCSCGTLGFVMKHKLLKGKSTKCKTCSNRLSASKDRPKPYSKEYEPPLGFKRYKDTYLYVSKYGEVFSSKAGFILTPGNGGSKGEYLRINTSEFSEYIHRMVGFVYIPLEDGREQINHKDKNTFNNSVSNLEWVTPSENIKHAFGHKNYKD